MLMWFWLPALTLAAIAASVLLVVWVRPPTVPIAVALDRFRKQREQLEGQFFQAAASSGKPRGLRWSRCEWGSAIELARDRKTGQLLALVGVTISFEAIEGGDMEGLAAVGNLRNASAVFFFDGLHWFTAGRVVFNLNPDEAIRHFAGQYEPVAS
jgi:hypothetical protein